MRRAGKVKFSTPKPNNQTSQKSKKKSGRAKKRLQTLSNLHQPLQGEVVVDRFEDHMERSESKELNEKLRSRDIKKDRNNSRDLFVGSVENSQEHVEKRFRDYFSFFHIEPSRFFELDYSYNLYQYDQEKVVTNVERVSNELPPFANSTIYLLSALVTVERFRKIVLNRMDWTRILDVYLPDGAIEEKMVEYCGRMCHLLANIAAFPDSYHVLFACNAIGRLNTILRQVNSSDLKSSHKNDLVLNAVRAISNLTLNDSYQDKLGLFEFLIQMVNDTMFLEQLNFETTEKHVKNRLNKDSGALQLIRYSAKALANLSSQDAFRAVSSKYAKAVDQLILLQYYQNDDQLSFFVELIVSNLCLSESKSISVRKVTNSESPIVLKFVSTIISGLQSSDDIEQQENNCQMFLNVDIESPFDNTPYAIINSISEIEQAIKQKMSFRTTTSSNIIQMTYGGGKCHKPVIYVYSETGTVVHLDVELSFRGEFTHLYPEPTARESINSNKIVWRTTADERGRLRIRDAEYGYIFWEGDVFKQSLVNLVSSFNKTSAALVPREKTCAYLEQVLTSTHGLVDSEVNDFITYWMPHLNKAEFNYIQFIDHPYTDIAQLSTIPRCETMIRVFMLFAGVSTNMCAESDLTRAPLIIETPLDARPPVRSGLTVVEWGGIDLSKYLHFSIGTCGTSDQRC